MNYLDVLLSFMMIIIQTNELTEYNKLFFFSHKSFIAFRLKLLAHKFHINLSNYNLSQSLTEIVCSK